MAKRCPSAESGKTSPAQLPNPTTPPSVQDEIAQQSPLVSSPAQLPNPTTPPVQDEIAQPGPSADTGTTWPFKLPPPPIEDPCPFQVMRTLQILSTAISSKRQQQRLLGTYSETSPSVSVPCPKCHTQVVVTSKILEDAKKPRNKGLQNIRNVEIELRARGQELPAWMKAYREGKMMDAAKLVHEHYVARKNSASTSNVAVQEATTSSSEQGPPSTVGPEENGPTQEKTEKRSNSE